MSRLTYGLIPFAFLAVLILGVLNGCQGRGMTPPKAEPPAVPFDRTEYEPYLRPGSASVTGQAFAKTTTGDIFKCAGETVVLHPATKFSGSNADNYRTAFSLSLPSEPDPKAILQKVVKRTTADIDGRFSFTGLPAGTYYLHCWVTVANMGPLGVRRPGYSTLALTKVALTDGEQKQIVLSDSTPSADVMLLRFQVELRMLEIERKVLGR